MQEIELQELFAEWKEKDKHAGQIFNYDGIVCKEAWDLQEKKILFLLKEAYHDDGKFISENQKHEYDLAYDLCENGPWNNIWHRVAEWAYGIIETTSSEIAPYKKLDESQANFYLKQIAVMNIKKSGGKSNSEDKDLMQYAEMDAYEILKEIELINPDIIICCYTIGYLISALEKLDQDPSIVLIDKKEHPSDNYHYKWKNRIVIDYYHPAARYPALLSYYGLLGSYKHAISET